MKIRDRLTLISSVIFSVVFIAASGITYLSFYRNSEKRIFNDLKRVCLISAIYYLEKDELPINKHDQIKEQYDDNMQDVYVGIYDEQNKLQFGEELSIDNITPERLNLARKNKRHSFKSKKNFYYGIYYEDNQGDFVVFVKTTDADFKVQTNQLMAIMGSVLLVGLLAIFFLSRLLSQIAYRPITNVIRQVNDIEASSLGQTIVSSGTNDEINELIDSYNHLLKRLSDTFLVQKNFINYVSHEFKTPLASIAGNLEVLAQKDRQPEEYKAMAGTVLNNVYEIEEILSTLMMLSGLKEPLTGRETFRVDEMIWDITDKISQAPQFADARVQFNTEVYREELLTVKGVGAQLSLALYNIIENAIKYSGSKTAHIKLFEKEGQLCVRIVDEGQGIRQEDLEHIQKAFYRGKNVGAVPGNGIGLSLATLIFAQNNILFTIHSKENHGTQVELVFPKL